MRESVAKAYLLYGYIGAGKTTFARRLETEEAAVRFTQDEWMQSLYGDDPPAEHFADYSRRISQLMEAMWTRCLELKVNVVLDFGFWSRRERDRVRALVTSKGGEAVLYHLLCTDDLAWKRIEKRNAELKGSLYIAPDTFKALKARFEPLDADEARIMIGAQGD